jgi:hypothetical protein
MYSKFDLRIFFFFFFCVCLGYRTFIILKILRSFEVLNRLNMKFENI